MLFSLDDLTTPLTEDDVKAAYYDVLGIVGVSVTSWKPGAVVRTMIAVTSVVISALSQLQAKIARSGFLELAEGSFLTLVAHYVYNADRLLAAFATGTVTLTNTGGGIYSGDPGDLVVSTLAGKTYRNVSPFSLGANATLALTVVADESGSGSNAAIGQISKLVTNLLGVTCTNALPLGARDDESDPALRIRCSEKLGARSPNGPADAYAYVARTATRADGSQIGVTRVRLKKDGKGNVSIYCASDSGPTPGLMSDPTSDIGYVHEAIQRLATPQCITPSTFGAEILLVSPNYEIWLYNTSGLTDAQIRHLIENADTGAMFRFLSSQPIGGHVIGTDQGKIFLDAMKLAIGTVRAPGATVPLPIFRIQILNYFSDIVVTYSQVPTMGGIIGIIHQVPPDTVL